MFFEEGQKMVGDFVQESSIHDSWIILDSYLACPPVEDEDGFQSFVLCKEK